MKNWRWVSAYMATSVLGLGMAYLLSMSLLAPAHSQNAPPPSDGSLPAEFVNETNSAPAAASGTATGKPAIAPAGPEAASPSVNSSTPVVTNNGTAVGAEQYVYDPAGRRDPFRPYRSVRIGDEKRVTGEVVLEPLQRFELDQLALIGILWDVRQPRALIRDSNGTFHTVVKNTKMGRHNGYVAVIREGEIVVVESLEEDGKTLKRTKLMEFQK